MSQITKCDGCEAIKSRGVGAWVTVSRKTWQYGDAGLAEFSESGDACSPECASVIAARWRDSDAREQAAEEARIKESVESVKSEPRTMAVWRACWFWRDK